VFSSDNGYHLGEYRLREGKQTPYDMDVRVPLVNADGSDPADPDYQAKRAGDPPTYQAVRTANALHPVRHR
jgi:hypothetical protein